MSARVHRSSPGRRHRPGDRTGRGARRPVRRWAGGPAGRRNAVRGPVARGARQHQRRPAHPLLLVASDPRATPADGPAAPAAEPGADDAVRELLDAALEAGAYVWPVLAGSVAALPAADDLPSPFERVSRLPRRPLRAAEWTGDVARIAEDLRELGVRPRADTQPGTMPVPLALSREGPITTPMPLDEGGPELAESADGGRRGAARPGRRGAAAARRLGCLALAAAPGAEPLRDLARPDRTAGRADLARRPVDGGQAQADGSARLPVEHARRRERPGMGGRARDLEGAHRQRVRARRLPGGRRRQRRSRRRTEARAASPMALPTPPPPWRSARGSNRRSRCSASSSPSASRRRATPIRSSTRERSAACSTDRHIQGRLTLDREQGERVVDLQRER